MDTAPPAAIVSACAGRHRIRLCGPPQMILQWARAIADARTADERLAVLLGVPAPFRELVGKLSALMIAGEIAELPEITQRRAALDQVPAELRPMVEERVRCAFQARQQLRRLDRQDELFPG